MKPKRPQNDENLKWPFRLEIKLLEFEMREKHEGSFGEMNTFGKKSHIAEKNKGASGHVSRV